MNTRVAIICVTSLLLAIFIYAASAATAPWSKVLIGSICGSQIVWLLRAIFTGHPMKSCFLKRNLLLKIRGDYQSKEGTYVMVEYGNGKIETVFLKDEFLSGLKLGGTYTWDGIKFQSAHA